jgi:hypothetical protein
MIGLHRSADLGSFISVPNEAALATTDVSGLTLGTFAFVYGESLYFQLVTDVSNNVVWQQVPLSSDANNLGAANYTTGSFDMLQAPGTLVPLKMPTRTGFYIVPNRYSFIIRSVTGVATGNFGWTAGTDAAALNLQGTAGAGPTAAQINSFATNGINQPLGGGFASGAAFINDAAANLKITATPTGVSACRGEFVFFGAWVPV